MLGGVVRQLCFERLGGAGHGIEALTVDESRAVALTVMV